MKGLRCPEKAFYDSGSQLYGQRLQDPRRGEEQKGTVVSWKSPIMVAPQIPRSCMLSGLTASGTAVGASGSDYVQELFPVIRLP